MKGIIKDIAKMIESMASHQPERVFRDWCECGSLSIQDSCDPFNNESLKRRGEKYEQIGKQYTKDEMRKFAEMFAELVCAFEANPFEDYLGQIYMQLFGGNKHLGQCFTPIHLCRACASVSIGEPPNELRTLVDDCCGGGAMLIAACEHYHKCGVNYQKYLKIYAGDLDRLCVHMTHIQLSLIGAKANVSLQDSIRGEVFETLVTPMCFIQ